jgi:hypothetical protein
MPVSLNKTCSGQFAQTNELVSGGIYLVLHEQDDSKPERFLWSFYYHVRYIEAGSLFGNGKDTTIDGRRYVISCNDSGHWVPRQSVVSGVGAFKSDFTLCRVLIGVSRNASAVERVMTTFDRYLNGSKFRSSRKWATMIVRGLGDAGLIQTRDTSEGLVMFQREIESIKQACEDGYLLPVHDQSPVSGPIVSSQYCF